MNMPQYLLESNRNVTNHVETGRASMAPSAAPGRIGSSVLSEQVETFARRHQRSTYLQGV